MDPNKRRYGNHCSLYTNQSAREEIASLLTMDMIYRRRREWPLLEAVPHPDLKVPPHEAIHRDFPLLSLILDKYRGKIAVCGGAVANALYLNASIEQHDQVQGVRDADIFFYGVSEEEANVILADCVAMMVSSISIQGYDAVYPHYREVRIERTAKYVNVHCRRHLGGYTSIQEVIYQFILRIYPTLDSILGAFDIPMSCFSYDGIEFRCTPIAAWCAENRVLIANLSRRSPSMEHRLVKYGRRFSMYVFFPGLNPDVFTTQKMLLREECSLVREHTEEYLKKLEWKGMEVLDPTDGEPYVSRDIQRDAFFRVVKPHIVATQSNLPRLHRIIFYPRDVEMARSKRPELHTFSKEESIRISDYSHTTTHNGDIPIANSRMLMLDNVEGVLIVRPFTENVTHEQVIAAFKTVVNNPKITTITKEQAKADFYLGTTLRALPSTTVDKLTGGQIGNLYRPSLRYVDGPAAWFERAWAKHERNLHNATGNLSRLRWNTQNPDVQWTASFEPLNATPRTYYGREMHRPFYIGIPMDLNVIMMLGRKDRNSYLFGLPNDIFKLLMNYILASYLKPKERKEYLQMIKPKTFSRPF